MSSALRAFISSCRLANLDLAQELKFEKSFALDII